MKPDETNFHVAARDPYKYFRVEARELLEGLQRGVAEFATAGADPERVSRLLRLAHTLKGAARVVRLTVVSDFAHRLEDVLALCRDRTAPPSAEQQSELRSLVHGLAGSLAVLDRPAESPAPAGGALSAPAAVMTAPLDTVRLQVAEVDAVLAGLADASDGLVALRADCRSLERAAHPFAPLPCSHVERTTAPLSGEAGDPHGNLARFGQRVTDRVDRLSRDFHRLHEDTERLRLIPTDALWSFLERTVRDAAQVLGKRAQFEPVSRARRFEPAVFAGLQETLLHLVRNAVAHGLESDAARRSAGKPPEGRVRVRVEHGRSRLVVTCEDDGGGIDVEAVRRVAVAKGWLAETPASPIGMDDAIRLLLRGGVTTTHVPTEMSGRGVGLDIARAAVARLGGELTITSTPGRGTTVTFEMPVTLATMETLQVESAGGNILVPLEAVQCVVRTDTTAIRHSAEGDMFHFDNRAVPYVALHRLVPPADAGSQTRSRQTTVVIIRGEHGTAAMGVDRLLGTTEALVRPLPAFADAAPFIAGASLGAGGPPRLVLDARALSEAIRTAGAAVPAPAATPATILVVDDSLTTRMLEQSILESAGYNVDLAVSGEDALQRLRHSRYELLLVDVEMPGMDGFTLIERLRGDPGWRDIPAILVTSRDSRDDRRRGLAAGAQDYVIKGEFDQRRLLRRIGELLA